MPQRLVKMINAGLSAGTAAMIGGDIQDNVTATGTTQATAAPIYGDNCIVTTTAAGTGVIFSGTTLSSGDVLQVYNLGANALLVYPVLGSTINALAVNAGFSIPAGKAAFFTVRANAATMVAGLSA